MSSKKDRQEMVSILEGLGYEKVGRSGHEEDVYYHPQGGRLSVPSTPSDHRIRTNVITRAKRQIRNANATNQRFMSWLRDKYHVEPFGMKELELVISDEVAEFVKSHGEGSATARSIVETARQHAALTIIRKGQSSKHGSTPGLYRLEGELYAVDRVLEEPVASVEEVQETLEAAGFKELQPEPANGATRDIVIPAETAEEFLRYLRPGVIEEAHDLKAGVELSRHALKEAIQGLHTAHTVLRDVESQLRGALEVLEGDRPKATVQ